MTAKDKILVIDDSVTTLGQIQTDLTLAGYEVITTTQTVGAARHLKNCALVILDLHMPGIDGTEVLRSLRSAAASTTTRPLFYLYTSDNATNSAFERLGFDGVFRDKGEVGTLVPQVDAALRLARLKELARH